jgi:hypothetical protein
MTAAAVGKQACPPYKEAHRANQPQEMERNAQTSATKKKRPE